MAEAVETGSNADSLTQKRTQALSRRDARAAQTTPHHSRSAAPAAPRRKWGSTLAVALAVPALFGTVALPAYAVNSNGSTEASSQTLTGAGAQSLTVDASAASGNVTREGFAATTDAEIATAAADAAAAQEREAALATAAAGRANFAATSTAAAAKYSSAATGTASTPQSYSLSAVYNEALKYRGVPYVYGGATPAGFDCSGFVKYVFAKFGISLPHNATTQANMGTRISVADAVPGDLVVSAGHIGFYAGNGMILHASRPGTPLRIGPIYASNWSIVRIAG